MQRLLRQLVGTFAALAQQLKQHPFILNIGSPAFADWRQ